VRLALFFHLGGDIDILAAPLAEAKRVGVGIRVLAAEKLWLENKRLRRVLEAMGEMPDCLIPPNADNARLSHALDGCDALLTGSETTLRPHKLAWDLTVAANTLNIATFTTQHGVENVGLTYFDDKQGADVVFASSCVFVWAPAEHLPSIVSPATRAKTIAVGYSPPPTAMFALEIEEAGLGSSAQRVVGVFENLHWTRFSDIYRTRFLADLEEVCARLPHVKFIFKPHPEGRWLTKRFAGPRPDQPNLTIADPAAAPWSLLTTPALTARLDAVVTTPSKVALDAAVNLTPSAIAAYDGPYPAYSALPALANANDWVHFLEQALTDRRNFESHLRRFRNEAAGGGEGASDMLRAIVARVRT